MSIEISRDGKFFSILHTDHLWNEEEDYRCVKCEKMLTNSYSYLIRKFKGKNLLKEDFKPLCCFCFFVKNVLKPLKCPDCKSLLDFKPFLEPKDKSYKVFCTKCKYKKIVSL